MIESVQWLEQASLESQGTQEQDSGVKSADRTHRFHRYSAGRNAGAV